MKPLMDFEMTDSTSKSDIFGSCNLYRRHLLNLLKTKKKYRSQRSANRCHQKGLWLWAPLEN